MAYSIKSQQHLHIVAEMYEHVQKAPFDLIQLLGKRYWDSSQEECLNCHIHPPLFLSFSPLSPLPPLHSPLQNTSLIQAKGLTLKQSLPLILAWLLRPPISSRCAWYLYTGASSLIKTDIDRRMWISRAIMCLLRIISVSSQLWEQKEIVAKVKGHVSFCSLFFVDHWIGCIIPCGFEICFCQTSSNALYSLQHILSWLRQVIRIKCCHPLFTNTKKRMSIGSALSKCIMQ